MTRNAGGGFAFKMAHYTCIGDNGTASIIGKCGIEKDDARMEALGSFDELNAMIGVAAAFSSSDGTAKLLEVIQDDIHTICAEIATAGENLPKITATHVESVERLIEEAERRIEPQKSFILPGGSKEAAMLHLARTIARRAERQLVALSKTEEVSQSLLRYANRLSSLFHIMARIENKRQDVPEEKPVYRYYSSP